MLKDHAKKKIEFLIRILLGVIFIYASLHKIENPSQFAKIIYGYGLFPEASINILAITIPYFELFAGLSLVFGIFPKGGAMIINIMLFCFIIAISINLARGYQFDCGCFSLTESSVFESAFMLLLRDIACLCAGVFVLIYNKPRLLTIKEA